MAFYFSCQISPNFRETRNFEKYSHENGIRFGYFNEVRDDRGTPAAAFNMDYKQG